MKSPARLHQAAVLLTSVACSTGPHVEGLEVTGPSGTAGISGRGGAAAAQTAGSGPEGASNSTSDAGAMPPADDAIRFDVPKDDVLGGCEREVKLSAVTVTAPAPFDVIIVADHSGSLSWSRDDLASGLQTFLSQIQGHDVRFFVLTPTQYGAASEEANSPLTGRPTVAWQDPVTLEAYTNAITSYSETCTDLQGAALPCPTYPEDLTTDFTLNGQWSFEMPPAVAAVTPDMDEAAIELEQQRIADAVLALGVGGSSDEQPVCTLNRYIAQSADQLPEHAVFLVLSDEDDVSDPSRCVGAQRIDVTVHGAKRIFEIPGTGKRSARKFTCTPVDDQGQATGTPVDKQWNLGACTAARDCNASDLQLAQDQCPVNHVMNDCRITCEEQTFVLCRVDETSEITDACNGSFTLNGVTYTDIVDYCSQRWGDAESWGTCTNYEKQDVAVERIELTPLMPDASLTDMTQTFRSRADAAFGTDGYSVELVSFQPEFTCTPQAGQSHAEQLRSLVDSPEHVFPICEEYSGALNEVREFARELIQTEYPLDLEETDDVAGVRVLGADDVARSLDPSDFVYDAESAVLRIEPSALRATDRGLEVDVLGDCVIR